VIVSVGIFRKRAIKRSRLLRSDARNVRDVIGRALARLADDRSTFIVTFNPEIMEECVRNAAYHEVLCSADMITCDGVGVALAAAIQGHGFPGRVTGVEISGALIESSAHLAVPLIVIGASPESRTAFEARARSRGALVQTGLSPPMGIEPNATEIARALPSPAVVLVALGAPKQEFLIDAIRRVDSRPRVYVGVGGAVDYLSGATRLPPRIIARLGLEWLYRLVTEPRKRLGRQMRSLPSFLWFEILIPLVFRTGRAESE